MANKLQGQLSEGGLASLLQYLALNRASGCLELSRGTERGRVFFERGEPVHALCAGLVGAAAVSHMLGWPLADFVFHNGAPSPQRTIKSSLDTLLLEAAYQADANALDAALSEQSILQPLPVPLQGGSVALSLGALHLLRRLDGKRTLGEIAGQLNVPFKEVRTAAQELLRQALAQALPGPVVPEAFLSELTGILVEFMGPVAEVVLEDTLFDLGLSGQTVPAGAVDGLIKALSAQLRQPAWRTAFEARAGALCRRYRLGR